MGRRNYGRQYRLHRLMTNDQAIDTGGVQHTKPCPDCPMARKSLRGWLGGSTPEEYVRLAHSDVVVPCHCVKDVQCAGMAIYRRNVAKRCDPPNLVLEKDKDLVFATPAEFLAHHQR